MKGNTKKQKAGEGPAAFIKSVVEPAHSKCQEGEGPNAGRMPALPDYVPVSQLDMYSSCSAVSVSIEMPSARSFKLAISWSTSGGRRCTPGSSLPLFFTKYSTDKAWFAKLMSITLAG